MMAASNDYTGLRIVRHVTKKGESLGAIAANYKLRSWEPIWRYNTAVRAVLKSGNPDAIPSGTVLYIPRSRKGYERTIRELKTLRDGADDIKLLAEIDRLEAEAGEFTVCIDFAASALTALGGVLVKGKKALDTVRVSQQAAAAEKARWFVYEMFDESKDELVSWSVDLRETMGAITKVLKDTALDKSIDKVLKQLPVGKEIVFLRKQIKESIVFAQALQHSTRIGKQEAKAFAEFIAGKAWRTIEYLDYANPSKLADLWLTKVLGESLDSTFRIQRKKIGENTARMQEQLDAQIKHLSAECDQVWGKTLH
jgi:hypothetical protein